MWVCPISEPHSSPVMRVLVLGSGVIGVTSAWYLVRAGHEVTVIDRRPGAGLETSFANGGQVSWGSGSPWAAPGVPLTALRWLFRRHSPLVFRPRLDPAMWAWLFRMLGNCTEPRYRINKERQLRLARYSHRCLIDLRRETALHYDESTRGTLVLYRDERDFEAARREADQLGRLGITQQLLDSPACVRQEPALKPVAEKLAGGLYFPEEESGDCHRFTEQLALQTRDAGATFHYDTQIEKLVGEADRILQVTTSRGMFTADAYVLACGSYSPLLLKPLGVRLPVYPVKGYSMTIPVTNPALAPQGTLTDEAFKIVLTRLGDRLRAAGTAELSGYNLDLRPGRLATLKHVVRDLFPDAGDMERAEAWTGLRPMTPDNPPVVGATPYKNLFLNTGHGTLGWTMASGSGKVLADLLSGRGPEIDLDGLTLARFS
jgi:D-amino-acid dehydrogenase